MLPQTCRAPMSCGRPSASCDCNPRPTAPLTIRPCGRRMKPGAAPTSRTTLLLRAMSSASRHGGSRVAEEHQNGHYGVFAVSRKLYDPNDDFFGGDIYSRRDAWVWLLAKAYFRARTVRIKVGRG